MSISAIDTNLLVYAYNIDSNFNAKASLFLQDAINKRDNKGDFTLCFPSQVMMEFIHVITWKRGMQKPLSLSEATIVVQDILNTGVPVIFPKRTQLDTFLFLLKKIKSRRKIFDIALAATLKDNGISKIYTVNVKDFEELDFLEATNPIAGKD